MREEAVNEILLKAGMGWEVVQTLQDSNKLKKVEFAGKIFYVRQLPVNQ